MMTSEFPQDFGK